MKARVTGTYRTLVIGEETIKAVKTYLSGGTVSPTVLIPCDLFSQADTN